MPEPIRNRYNPGELPGPVSFRYRIDASMFIVQGSELDILMVKIDVNYHGSEFKLKITILVWNCAIPSDWLTASLAANQKP